VQTISLIYCSADAWSCSDIISIGKRGRCSRLPFPHLLGPLSPPAHPALPARHPAVLPTAPLMYYIYIPFDLD
jgi:hypothetical protein